MVLVRRISGDGRAGDFFDRLFVFRGNIAVYSIKTYADDVTSRDFSLELQQTTRSTIHDYAQ
jgi:hypothetical protein